MNRDLDDEEGLRPPRRSLSKIYGVIIVVLVLVVAIVAWLAVLASRGLFGE